MMTDSRVSEKAMRVLAALRAAGADRPERAIPDGRIATAARVPCRQVIDLAEELVAIDVAILATCGKKAKAVRADGTRYVGPKGRFICADPAWVRLYAEKLHRRAKAIHGRAAQYSALAERMEQRRMTETTGQRRLFA